jgi:hypothetical protein
MILSIVFSILNFKGVPLHVVIVVDSEVEDSTFQQLVEVIGSHKEITGPFPNSNTVLRKLLDNNPMRNHNNTIIKTSHGMMPMPFLLLVLLVNLFALLHN